MISLTNFQAFVTGLIIGIFIPIIFLQIRKLLPRLYNYSQQQGISKKNTRETEIENQIRQYFIQECQRNHLLGSCCPLEDVFVETNLMSHYYYTNPGDLLDNEPLIYQLFPDYSDFPELSTVFPCPNISIEEAAQNRHNLALMGDIGTGKTALLSSFASNMLGRESENGQEKSCFPLFFHCHDLLESNVSEDFLQYLVDLLLKRIKGFDKEQITSFLLRIYDNYRLTLIIDGMDELPQSHMDDLSARFVQLSRVLPKLQVIAAIGPYYTSTLADGNFAFCSMMYPKLEMRKEILSKIFGVLGLDSEQSQSIEFMKLQNLWDDSSFSTLSIGEVVINSLRSIFSSDQIGADRAGVIGLFVDNSDSARFLKILAGKICANNFLPVSLDSIHLFMTDTTTEFQSLRDNQQSSKNDPNKKNRSPAKVDLFSELLELGLLKLTANNRSTIKFPIVLSKILDMENNLDVPCDPISVLRNPQVNILLKNDAQNSSYLGQWINRKYDSFQPIILSNTCRHILAKTNLEIPPLITALLPEIISSDNPCSVKYKLFFCVTQLNIDVQKLLDSLSRKISDKQLFNRLIAIALPSLPGNIRSNVFRQVIATPDPIAQSIALNWNLFGEYSNNSVTIQELLRTSREPFSSIITELISLHMHAPQLVFSELSSSSEISIRKAVVHGLRFNRSPWAKTELERILAEDDQWIVRDAVAHALESPWDNHFPIPQNRENPNQSSWLLQQASNRGIGIPANQYPEELILSIINEGSLEEKKVALGYLFDYPTKGSIQALQVLSKRDNPLQNDAVFYLNRLMTQKRFIDLLV